jgi:ribosomal protein L37AE/L43A
MSRPNGEKELVDLLQGYTVAVHKLTWNLIRDAINTQQCSTCQTTLNGGTYNSVTCLFMILY